MQDPQSLENPITGQAPTQTSSENMIAIVEPMLCEDLMRWIYEEEQTPQYVRLFQSTRFELINEGPIAILLAPNSNLTTKLVRSAEIYPCASFFTLRTNDFQTVIHYLRGRLIATTDRSVALFRFYEPRMLLPLLTIMTPHERTTIFYQVAEIFWFKHKWHKWNLPETSEQNFEEYQWTFTADVQQKLSHAMNDNSQGAS